MRHRFSTEACGNPAIPLKRLITVEAVTSDRTIDGIGATTMTHPLNFRRVDPQQTDRPSIAQLNRVSIDDLNNLDITRATTVIAQRGIPAPDDAARDQREKRS
jgi:hypothetical protein